jgi:hypothetical protein
MGDVYLSHGISHKGCLTSADADANLALSEAFPTAAPLVEHAPAKDHLQQSNHWGAAAHVS